MNKFSSYIQSNFLDEIKWKEEERLDHLEKKQENLRRGIFKRWSEQEEKIKHLHQEIQILTGILEGAINYDA